MAILSIPFNGSAQDLADFCAAYGYQPTLTNPDGTVVPNPETRNAFFGRMLREYAAGIVKRYRAGQAGQAAQLSANQANASLSF